MAVAGFYRRRIGELVRSRDWRTGGALVVSGVPAIGVYAVVKDWLEGFSSDMGCVGIAMLFTGLVLCTTRFLRLAPSGRKGGYLEALLIGCAQAVALFPGVSRSGMTISAARALRLEPKKAAEFSFLMSLLRRRIQRGTASFHSGKRLYTISLNLLRGIGKFVYNL